MQYALQLGGLLSLFFAHNEFAAFVHAVLLIGGNSVVQSGCIVDSFHIKSKAFIGYNSVGCPTTRPVDTLDVGLTTTP